MKPGDRVMHAAFFSKGTVKDVGAEMVWVVWDSGHRGEYNRSNLVVIDDI